MSVWLVAASGQSLDKQQCDIALKARSEGKINGIAAVSNVGLNMITEADILVSHDTNWWNRHPSAMDFGGRKFSGLGHRQTERFKPPISACNSGLMAMYICRDLFMAHTIFLIGFDMHGTHYFGKHPEGLKNSTQQTFNTHISQFKYWTGANVINCTPNSALKKFPHMQLMDAIIRHGN